MQPAKSKQSLLNLTLCVKITHLSLRYQSEKINPERTQVNFRKSETVKKIILALYQIKEGNYEACHLTQRLLTFCRCMKSNCESS